MENESSKVKRRKTPWVVGTLMVASLALLIILQSTSLWREFTITSSSDLLLLYALSSLNFVAFMIFAFIFLRSIIKLVRERRTFQLGAKLKSRLLIYFFAVSLLPILAMAVFSYLFMNRALERWFTEIPGTVIKEAREVQRQSLIDRSARLDESARMIASVIGTSTPDDAMLERLARVGGLVHIEFLAKEGVGTIAFESEIANVDRPEIDRLLAAARSGQLTDPSQRDGRGFDIASAELVDGRRLIIIPDPFSERTVSQIVENSLLQFDDLKQKEVMVRQLGLLTLGVLTFLLIFASSWIAFYVARGLTAPIKALAEGAGEIAKGNLGHRVEVLAEDELAILVNAFNDMSARLDASSTELGERRRYIETVLETLPTGVISFDADNRVTTINGSAAEILGRSDTENSNLTLADLATADDKVVLVRLLVRARRVGHASDNTVFKTDVAEQTDRSVSITASALPSGNGVVLVIEDLSELIAAQRASAWQEVARRMAHEIKNPLTPIQLSAERIAKRFETGGEGENGLGNEIVNKAAMASIVHESTDTILREVSSLKTMVDEFARFARLPNAKLETGDVTDVIRQAVATYRGREPHISVRFEENGALPGVLLDAEQLKRVFVNLIDNAIEAFDGDDGADSVTITARYDLARDIVVVEVSDTGKGIAPTDLQKLFQPYFSTKGRGTGLGLAIVSRIIAEHRGRIKVVTNQPRGAKFIIELPALL